MRQSSSYVRRTAVGLGSMLTGATLLVAGFSSQAAAEEDPANPPTSQLIDENNNPTCADVGDFDHEFKIDQQPIEGDVYGDTETDFSVEITDVTAGDPMTISFESNFAVSVVLVKASPAAMAYTFDPLSTVGTDLASPKDSISHVSFCWDDDETTTTEDDSSTTTEDDTTTTVEDDGTTTTVEDDGTTTTVEDDDTTTTVEGETTTTVEVDDEAATTTTVAGDQLPRTGSTTMPLLVAGAVLLAGGTGLIAATRRFRRS